MKTLEDFDRIEKNVNKDIKKLGKKVENIIKKLSIKYNIHMADITDNLIEEIKRY